MSRNEEGSPKAFVGNRRSTFGDTAKGRNSFGRGREVPGWIGKPLPPKEKESHLERESSRTFGFKGTRTNEKEHHGLVKRDGTMNDEEGGKGYHQGGGGSETFYWGGERMSRIGGGTPIPGVCTTAESVCDKERYAGAVSGGVFIVLRDKVMPRRVRGRRTGDGLEGRKGRARQSRREKRGFHWRRAGARGERSFLRGNYNRLLRMRGEKAQD